jgi:hypothetical protein
MVVSKLMGVPTITVEAHLTGFSSGRWQATLGHASFSGMWCVGDKTDARDNETTNDVAVAWFAAGPQRLLIVSEDT